MARASKPINQPYPFYKTFPSPLERFMYRSYNRIENRLWPVRPLPFAAIALAVGAQRVTSHGVPLAQISLTELAKHAGVALGCTYLYVVLLRQLLKRTYFSYRGYMFEKPGNVSFATKLWGLVHKFLVFISPPRLQSCDLLLPSPSCPDLDDVINRYLDSVKHLVSEEEFKNIKKDAEQFLQNEGPQLQLKIRLYSLFVDNYITPFWEKYAYLYGRYPLLINSSVAHVDLLADRPSTVAVRAAHVTYIEVMSHLAIDRDDYAPLGKGLVCSRHYDKMYSVTRIPEEGCDYLKNHGISKHVVFLCRGQFYKVPVTDKKNRMLSVDDLSKIYYEIFERSAKIGNKFNEPEGRVAALTHDNRDQWAKNRKEFFLSNAINRRTLEAIESAVFFFVFDENDSYGYDPENPKILSNFMKSMLTGNGLNRWCDKSLNYQIGSSTRCGGTTEHSIADGAEFDHIMENFVMNDVVFLKYPSLEEQKKIEVPQDEDWKRLNKAELLPVEVNDKMASEIERCYDAHTQVAGDVDLVSLAFRDFGKGRIKECGVSPDAFVQMALQLAVYRDQGKFVLTYEPASSRFYKNSRTETLRTVGDESCAFVKAMIDPNETNDVRISLLKKACSTHSMKNRECMVGKGIDRHLFVMYCFSKGFGVSSPFLDHYISQQWSLSTSHVPNVTNQVDEDANIDSTWLGASFGAVSKSGYGVCYRFGGNHSILAHISSYHSSENTDSNRFRDHIVAALHEMSAMFS